MNYEEFKTKYRICLNEQQESAVKAAEGNVLLLAVPGSGKTTVLVTRLAYMIECCGIAPDSILTMTYTVAATNDMKKRYAALFGAVPKGLEFRTINSLCCDVIRTYEYRLGKCAFPLIAEEERAQIIASVYREINGEFASEADRKDVSTAITYVKNMLLSVEEIDAMETEVKNFPQIFRKYKEEMVARQKMDFDDQLCYALTILKKYPEILAWYRKRFTHICLDEAQDTSKIQHEIIRIVNGENGNLFMVGDEDQSIYAFRAAYPEALINFEKVYINAKVLLMEKNYRSTVNIAAAADVFISRNRSRHEKHMTAASGEEGRPICAVWLKNRAEQYEYLLSEVPRDGKQTAVLYRDNASAIPLIDALRRRNEQYSSRGLDCSFFSSRIVRDVTDIIRFAENPSDPELFLNIYFKISSYVDRRNALLAADLCRPPMDIPTWLYLNAMLKDNIRKRQYILKHQLEEMLTLPGGKAVFYIEKELGYGKFMEREKMNRNGLDILRLIGNNEPSPQRLLERLSELEQAVQQGGSGRQSDLILSTIHSAKGLEYDRVYLMDVIDGVLPQCGANGSDRELEEERRLFYVGMTRAREELYVFRFKGGALPSEFSENIFEKPYYDEALPQSAPTATKIGTDSAGKSKSRSGGRKQKIKPPAAIPNDLPDLSRFAPGIEITHSKFGRGIIETIDVYGIATVDFGEKGKKTLSLSACMKNGIVK